MKISASQKSVTKALLAYSRKMDDWVKPIKNKRRFRASTANAFMLGVMFDRSINADRAWEAAEWINDSLGNPENVTILWKELKKLPKQNLTGFLRYGYGGKSFHRHYKTFAKQLPEAADIILAKYDGDPRKIWNNQRDVSKVRGRFEQLPGIGSALSRMAVLILARNYGMLGGFEALSQLDVKPDIHVKRVFNRSGLISQSATENDAIEIARKLHPKFPGALDAPAFEIGVKWCRPTKRKCEECPISDVCPSTATQQRH